MGISELECKYQPGNFNFEFCCRPAALWGLDGNQESSVRAGVRAEKGCWLAQGMVGALFRHVAAKWSKKRLHRFPGQKDYDEQRDGNWTPNRIDPNAKKKKSDKTLQGGQEHN